MPCEGQLFTVHTWEGLAGWNKLFSNCALLHLWPWLCVCTDGLNCFLWDWGLWRVVWLSRWNQGSMQMCQTLYIQTSRSYLCLCWLYSVLGSRKFFNESIQQRWIWMFIESESYSEHSKIVLHRDWRVGLLKEKVQLNCQTVSVFVPVLCFVAAGMGICSLLALREGESSYLLNTKFSQCWCLHMWD